MDISVTSRAVGLDPMYKIWHIADRNMLLYIHSGDGSIVCSEKSYPMKKGILCFIGGKKHRYTMPLHPKTYIRSKVSFSTDLLDRLRQLLSPFCEAAAINEHSFVYACLDADSQQAAETLLHNMSAPFVTDPSKDILQLSYLLQLFALLEQHSTQSSPSADGLIPQALEYINQNIFSPLQIEHICTHLHMSKYYFCRKFKETVGMTVMEYILHTRIVHVKILLADERMSVSQISDACGFSSLSYFSRVFKQETGMTPTKYREHLIIGSALA